MSIDLAKGNLNWTVTLNQDASVISSPSVINNKIIIGARDQRVHCLERQSGKKLWSFKTQGVVDASPIVDEKRVLVCSNDGRVYILDINTGKELFSFDLGSAISGTPAIVEGLIVIAADNGNIYGFKF
jgi:outer membrane protein assembly factor BamB